MAMMFTNFMPSFGLAGYSTDSLFSGYNNQLKNFSSNYMGRSYIDNYTGVNRLSSSGNDTFTPSYTPTRTSYQSNKDNGYDNPTTLVAPNEHARLWGDPHIDDADGGQYDFQHEGIFSLLEDKGISVNGNLEKSEDGNSTYMTEAGLMVNGKQVHIDTDGTVTLGTGANAYELEDGETRQLGNGSYITRDGDLVRVGNSEYKLEFQTNQDDNGNAYINLDAYTKDGGVSLDGVDPTGLLGETFDKGSTVRTKPKLDPSDYEQDGLFATNQPDGTDPGNSDGNPFFGTFG